MLKWRNKNYGIIVRILKFRGLLLAVGGSSSDLLDSAIRYQLSAIKHHFPPCIFLTPRHPFVVLRG